MESLMIFLSPSGKQLLYMIAPLEGNSIFKLSSLNLDTNHEGALRERANREQRLGPKHKVIT